MRTVFSGHNFTNDNDYRLCIAHSLLLRTTPGGNDDSSLCWTQINQNINFCMNFQVRVNLAIILPDPRFIAGPNRMWLLLEKIGARMRKIWGGGHLYASKKTLAC